MRWHGFGEQHDTREKILNLPRNKFLCNHKPKRDSNTEILNACIDGWNKTGIKNWLQRKRIISNRSDFSEPRNSESNQTPDSTELSRLCTSGNPSPTAVPTTGSIVWPMWTRNPLDIIVSKFRLIDANYQFDVLSTSHPLIHVFKKIPQVTSYDSAKR